MSDILNPCFQPLLPVCVTQHWLICKNYNATHFKLNLRQNNISEKKWRGMKTSWIRHIHNSWTTCSGEEWHSLLSVLIIWKSPPSSSSFPRLPSNHPPRCQNGDRELKLKNHCHWRETFCMKREKKERERKCHMRKEIGRLWQINMSEFKKWYQHKTRWWNSKCVTSILWWKLRLKLFSLTKSKVYMPHFRNCNTKFLAVHLYC